MAVRHVEIDDQQTADPGCKHPTLLVREIRYGRAQDFDRLTGEDCDAIVGSLTRVDGLVTKRGDVCLWKVAIWELGFLQRHDIGLSAGQPLGELWQPNSEGVHVPSSDRCTSHGV